MAPNIRSGSRISHLNTYRGQQAVAAGALVLAASAGFTNAACSSTDGGAGVPNQASGGAGGTGASGAPGGGMAGTMTTAGAGAGGTSAGSSGAAGTAGGGGVGGAGGTAGAGGSAGAGGTAGAGGSATCTGNAVSFNANTGAGNDAAKAVVVVPQNTDLPTGNTQRTIEFWAYVLSSSWAGDANTMFFYGTNNRVADGFGLDFGGVEGTIDPFTNAIFDNDDQPTGLDASTDTWAHFAMTWDGTAVRAFVNGVQKAMKVSNETQKVLMTGNSPLYIGTYGPSYFNGKIDEFRTWNVNRSEADIQSTMGHTLVGNESGLVGYWKFDEQSGTTAKDSVTSAGHQAHDGMLQAAAPEQLPTWVPGAPLTCP